VEILFITPEIAPYSRSGEIGDVCAALPKALRSIGHKVTVISPLWGCVDATARGLARRLSGVEATVGGSRYPCTLHDGRTTGGVELIFVGQSESFAGLPGEGPVETRLEAALVFAQAAAQVAAQRQPTPDVLHAHHWFAGGALALAQAALPAAVRVFSLHDVSDDGPLTALRPGVALPDALREFGGSASGSSLLRICAASADRVVANSQHEANLLLEDPGALGDVLRADAKLVGIPDGLDAARWNPVTDPLVAARFDPVDLKGKARCKSALQLELDLPIEPDAPLLVHVAATGDERADLPALVEIVSRLVHNDLQLVVLGSDSTQLEDLRELSERYPERLKLLASDERARHRALAAADLVLITTAKARDGDLHLSAQRYGALPITRRTGAMADGVVDCEAALTTGSGFLYESNDPDELIGATQRALAAFSNRTAFDVLRRRVMKQDVSWERSARRYEHLYRSLKPA
jgi:starch synthase